MTDWRTLREVLAQDCYQPALLDGRPVEVWMTGRTIEMTP